MRVRLDSPSTRQIVEAAQRRGMSVSDDVRTAADSQARRELDLAKACVIIQTPAEQLEFWSALNARVRLTIAQSRPEQLLDPTPRR
jgi:hypothetical protein